MTFPRLPKTLHRLTAGRRTAVIVGAVVLVGLVIGSVASAQGNIVVNAVGNSIFLIVNNLLMGMIKMFASLTGIFISLLVLVARYNTFLDAPIVQQGWPIVRDLMNMMFIIGLLMISAGTVLRLQNYRYNRLLGKLIIMAFLVNFSKFIAVFLLQFAQIVMLTFVNAFRDVAFGNFTHMFGLDAVLNFAQTFERSAGTNLGIFITLLAGLAMMLVAFVVMLAITIMLFVRIIALWLLIILSPIAYALRILPNTERFASQWWQEFTKYAVLGPVLAFFLWISLALVGGGSCAGQNCNNNPLKIADPTLSDAQDNANIDTKDLRSDFVTELLSLDRLITFIVGIIFLMMGLQYAQKSGAAGASFAGKVATAGFGAAATLTGLNAIRDRTLAPIQGYMAQRKSRRDAGIRERTVGLGARVDQGLSATVGQVGRVRAGAAGTLGATIRGVGQVATGQRTIAQVQQQVQEAGNLGLQQGTRAYRQARGRISEWQESNIDREIKEKDMNNAAPAVLNAMRNSAGGATRMAAELTGMNRGTIQFEANSPDDVDSLNNMLGEAASVQNNPALRKRYQDAIEKVTKRPSTTPQALRHILDDRRGASDPITRLDAGEELANRRLLNAPDAIAINKLAEATSADKATAFRKTLYLKQGDIALQAFHDGLATEQDADSFVEAVDRGEARQDLIRKDRVTGGNPVREQLRNKLYQMHQTKGTLDKIREGMSDEVNEYLYQDLNLSTAAYEDQVKVALATGHGKVINPTKLKEFTSRYANQFAEKISASSAGDSTLIDQLLQTKNIFKPHLKKMAERSGLVREELNKSLETLVTGSADPDVQKSARSSVFALSFGKINKFDNIDSDPNQQTQFEEVVAGMDGADLSQIMKSNLWITGGPAKQAAISKHAGLGLRTEEVPKAVGADRKFWQQSLKDAFPSLNPDAQKAWKLDIKIVPHL